MDILERIERGELTLIAKVFTSKKDWHYSDDAAAELMRLARLGAAAEKAMEQHCNIGYGGKNCGEDDCEWQDFCRLRGGVENGR